MAMMGNIMKVHRLRMGLMLAVSLSACIPDSTNPLSDPETAKIDRTLVGTWVGEMEEGLLYFHFLGNNDGSYEVIGISQEKDSDVGIEGEWSVFSAFTSQIKGTKYLNIQPIVDGDDPTEILDEDAPYILMRYDVRRGKELRLWMLSIESAEAAVEAGLTGEVHDGWISSVSFTASTEELSAYVGKSNPNQLFPELMGTFKKIK